MQAARWEKTEQKRSSGKHVTEIPARAQLGPIVAPHPMVRSPQPGRSIHTAVHFGVIGKFPKFSANLRPVPVVVALGMCGR